MIARYVSLAILIFLTIVLGITFFQVIVPFLLPLFLAAVVALIGQPVYLYFLKRTNNRSSLAAGLATGSLVAAVILPVFVGVTVGALQLYATAEIFLNDQAVEQVINSVKEGEIYDSISRKIDRFFPVATEHEADLKLTEEQKAEIERIEDPEQAEQLREKYLQLQAKKLREKLIHERAEQLRESVRTTAKKLALSTFSPGTAMTTVDLVTKLGWMSMGLFTFVIALYYFFAEGPTLLQYAIELIPVDIRHQQNLLNEFGKAIRAVVSATFLAAIAQGLATSLALWFLGFEHFVLLTIVGTFSALIPLAGTWLVWVPYAIYMVYNGQWGWALALCVYGFGFIGMLDNIIRAYVLNSDAKLHPLLAFVSVLGGLQVMGLWGVFIAPVIASCLYALIRISNEELLEIAELQKENVKNQKEDRKNTSNAEPETGADPQQAKQESEKQETDT